MGIHDGHRQRLWEHFRKAGLDDFDEIQVLELLLFYTIRRRETNTLAHNLLNHFGSLATVLEASVEELEQVDGIGHESAVFLHLVTEVGRYYMINRLIKSKVLTTTEDCGEFLVPRFYGRRNETVFVLCLDAKCKVLACQEISEGSINSAGISPRRVAELALFSRAASVVLAHNHPSGLAVPSREDVQATYRVEAALDAVEIVLADHLIISDGDYTSMLQSGYYKPRSQQPR